MSKWPAPYDKQHEPPEVLYLGVDNDTGKIQTSWWIWRMRDDDIVYVRKDIADRRMRTLKERYDARIKSLEEVGKGSGGEASSGGSQDSG